MDDVGDWGLYLMYTNTSRIWCPDYFHVSVWFQGDLQNGSLPIDLLYERSIEEKIEQQTTEDFGSISKMLLLKGLALPVR